MRRKSMSEMISFACPNGTSAHGYLARAGSGAPGIVVLQEWWGLNEQIQGVADRFAAAGFTALAPDLYAGRVTQDPNEAEHLMTGLDWIGATEQEVRGAVQFLKQEGGKVAVSGFCMGGALTIMAAVRVPEVAAGVCFYGIPPTAQTDPGAIRVPLQGHFANQDDWCTPVAVDELERVLQTSGVVHELYRYEAQHGFMNERRPEVYDAAATRLAWQRSVDFLRKHLQ
jgi:carboxymethylenebutenolidase